mmetsp:Transcript_6010/g.5178  ORF Transcript_6010/g.5178 Transcript_6010/m.5178 type:complete len:183 (+) Transcript_6010:44-592(+)
MNTFLFRRFSTVAKNPSVFFDISIAKKPVGRMTFELYVKDTPKTSTNFLELCKGHKLSNGTTLTYKNSIFHRVIPGFMAQGGDITNRNGTGGLSIYGQKFPDENFKIKHTKPGLLSMANSGPNTNGSQFFITTVKTPWLDGNHTVFGELTDGASTLNSIEEVGTQGGNPRSEVEITDCGELE